MTNQTPVSIPVDKLHPFVGHPYKVKDDEEMNTLIESIQAQGVLTPLIVRPLEETSDEYEVVSGHRRLRAAEKAGMKEVPAFIYALDRDAAAIAVVDSNLHRAHILPSEKAFAYKLKLDAMNRQGITSGQIGQKWSRDEMAESTDDSSRQIQRYIRLTNLILEILEYVDSGKMALTPAVELSYLTEKEQFDLLETMESEDCTPSLSQAQQMKRLSQSGELNADRIFTMLTEQKPNQREKLKIPMERIRGFFPKEYTAEQIETSIVKLCEAQYRKRMRDRDAR
ncbi:MAG: ParB/RepB/Spo0J family partition protein [Clostridia bacterium]|nr:ParB/RepB/Spo0J family partition protein [Clostridia bacterium]